MANMLGMNVGPVVLHILGHNLGAMAAMKQTEKRALTMSQTINKHASKAILGMTVPLTAFGIAASKAFGSFDSAMTKSTAIMKNITQEQRKNMESLALNLSKSGKKGVQSATELADAYYYLVSAGLSYSDTIKSLPVVQEFATAGTFSLVEATYMLTDAQSALGLTTKDAATNMKNMQLISDTLNAANRAAHGSVQQFSKALTTHAANAMRTYRISLNEGMAVLAAFANQGLKAQRAGTMFARMLRLTTQAYERNVGIWERANLSLFDQHDQWLEFSEIFGKLSEHFEGLKPEEITKGLIDLGFQMRSAQTIMPLIGMADQIAEFSEKFKGENVAGTSLKVAEKQLKSFNNELKLVWNNLKAIGISIGRHLSGPIRLVGEHIKSITENWDKLSDETQSMLVKIGILAAALPVIGLTLTAAFNSPLTPIVAIVALGYTARAVWLETAEKIKNAFDTVFGNSLKSFKEFQERIKNVPDSSLYPAESGMNVLPRGKAVIPKGSRYPTGSGMNILGIPGAVTPIDPGTTFGIPKEKDVLSTYDYWMPQNNVTGLTSFGQSVFSKLPKGQEAKGAVAPKETESLLSKTMSMVRDQLEEDGLLKYASDAEKNITELRSVLQSFNDDLQKAAKEQVGSETHRSNIIKAQIKMYEDLGITNKKVHDLKMKLLAIEADNMSILTDEDELAMKWLAHQEIVLTRDTTRKVSEAYIGMYDQMNQYASGSFEHRLKLLSLEAKRYYEITRDIVAVEQWRAEQVRILEQEQDIASDSFIAGFNAKLQQMRDNYTTLGQIGAQAAEGMVEGLTDSMWELATATDNWTESLRNVGRELAAMAGKAALSGLLRMGISSAIGAFAPGAGGVAGNSARILAKANAAHANFHTGGVITAHTGTILRSDERMVKAKVGEGIFTADQMRAMGSPTRDSEMKSMLSEIRDKIGPTSVALFDDRDSMEQYLTSRSGTKTLVKVSRRHRREING